MSKFTPGLWKIKKNKNVYHIYDLSDLHIATIFEYEKETEKANAELIAIAPDMYKFLLDLIKYPESIDPMQFMGLKEEAHRIIKGVE